MDSNGFNRVNPKPCVISKTSLIRAMFYARKPTDQRAAFGVFGARMLRH